MSDQSDEKDEHNLQDVGAISSYGFSVPLNHKYSIKGDQSWGVGWKEFFTSITLSIRYLWWYWKIIRLGRKPTMDFFNRLVGRQIYGAPIGGIGAGTIGRGFKGEFCRYSLIPGILHYDTVLANQFIVTIRSTDGNTLYHQVLSPNEQPKELSSWRWGFDGKNARYTALYPRSWTEYIIKEPAVKLICRQISPIIPNNYKDSSLPCAVFVWKIINMSERDLNVSITFTFRSGTGDAETLNGDKWTESFECEGKIKGVMIHQELKGMPCTYAIASTSSANVDISRMLVFDPTGDGRELWESLERTGELNAIESQQKSTFSRKHVACAVCACAQVSAMGSNVVEFSLVWDMPKIHFHCQNREYLRYYTKYFYDDKQSVAPEIVLYALTHYGSWELDIHKWQQPVLEDIDLPEWYKSALFNELYYVADGGTVWVRTDETDKLSTLDPRNEYGRFAYLEGHEYRMYNTYDVHFYAAFSLVQLWPNLQASIQYEIRDAIKFEDSTILSSLIDGTKYERKLKGYVPHDVGDPCEEPFQKINAYFVHDICAWKDLNLKFVLSCYRDYSMSGNVQFLFDFWPSIIEVLDRSLEWDTDKDGLIENSGIPDQTYDTWVMEGPSAYCGSLWLASLHCAVEIGKLVEDMENTNKYAEVLERGKVAFQEKLWNGRYYNFDTSKSDHRECIMSDQLCGQWFLRASGFNDEVFPEERVKSALKTIFENNVLKYKDGCQGAVNGFLPTGCIDPMTIQSKEMWTGVSYGLSALMIHEDMIEEGFRIAEGVYRTVWEKIGMGFETPEALYENYSYRAIGYMRPLAIWAIHHAWTSRNARIKCIKEEDTKQLCN